MDATAELYDRIVDKSLLIRRLNIVANHVIDEASAPKRGDFEQLDLFTDYAAVEAKREKENAELEREKRMQKAMLSIKKKVWQERHTQGHELGRGCNR